MKLSQKNSHQLKIATKLIKSDKLVRYSGYNGGGNNLTQQLSLQMVGSKSNNVNNSSVSSMHMSPTSNTQSANVKQTKCSSTNDQIILVQ